MANLTFGQYERILDATLESGQSSYCVRDYIQVRPQGDFVIFRHDAELLPRHSLIAGELEARRGIRSTYYFHGPHRRVFSVNAMKQLVEMGHEVGYHYETLDRCRGDFGEAKRLFADDLKKFRDAGIHVTSVCAHGNPRIRKRGYKDNSDLFRHDGCTLEEFGLIGEAYLSIDFSQLEYASDVGVRFAAHGSSDNLIHKIRTRQVTKLYVLTHPDYWSVSRMRDWTLTWAGKAVRSLNVNAVVKAIRDATTPATKKTEAGRSDRIQGT